MKPFMPIAWALVCAVVAAVPTAIFAQGQPPPIETRTLVDGRVEQLPGGPLCWDVRTGRLEPGSSSPAAGYHTHGLVVSYVFDGIEQITYEDGRSVILGPGEAALIEEKVPHRHESAGAVARTNLNFELACEAQANSLANTGALQGVRAELGAYRIQARERSWPTGARTPVHVISGPTSTFVLEGTIQRDTASGGLACTGSGALYVSPVGELAQNISVGSAAARTVDVDIWPAGEIRTAPQGPEVHVWHKSLDAVDGSACPASE
jgi:quercetin dioxygenase-like cupin family protein